MLIQHGLREDGATSSQVSEIKAGREREIWGQSKNYFDFNFRGTGAKSFYSDPKFPERAAQRRVREVGAERALGYMTK
jgi:hypothetical protein